MAAILPPISGQRGHMTQAPPPEYVKEPQTKQKVSVPIRLAPLKKGQGKADRELMEKRLRLRQEQKILTKQETDEYRNVYIHTLSLDMLSAGYHLSFKELFALINQQEAERQRAGPESLMWNQVMLTHEEDKLQVLQKYLTQAETAQRQGEYVTVYKARQEMAKYFQGTGDKWLSDHFYQTCLDTSKHVTSDGGCLHAEAQCYMGKALEEKELYYEAVEHFENYYNLSYGHGDWILNDITFTTDACIHLFLIYCKIGDSLESTDPQEALEYLLRAFKKAKESCDRKFEGEAAYKLGLGYERIGDGESALLHLNHYLETCKCSDDTEGVGRACDAIAKAYARKGEVHESISYLKQFVEMSERSGNDSDYSKACHNLGNLYNKLGLYEEATEYFSKAYNMSRSLGEPASINMNRVQYGIAQAHRMLIGFGQHIVPTTQPCIERLIEWKSARTDEFDKPLTIKSPTEDQKETADTNQNQRTAEQDTPLEEQDTPLQELDTPQQEVTSMALTPVVLTPDREVTGATTTTLTTEPTDSAFSD